MLQINPQKANAFYVNVNYAQPYSRTTYVIDGKYDTGTTSILNIGYASYSRGNFTPEEAERKRRKKMHRAHVRF